MRNKALAQAITFVKKNRRLLELIILVEVICRISVAFKMNDAYLMLYPFFEATQAHFTYNNFSISGSLEPQNQVGQYRKYHPGPKKIYVRTEDGALSPYWTRINSSGFRGEIAQSKKVQGHHPFRIICLGESSTFGAFNRDNETWCWQLNKILNDNYPDKLIEVLNFGVSESRLKHHIALAQAEIADLRPDVVLFYGGHNDLTHHFFGQENRLQTHRFPLLLFDVYRTWRYRREFDLALRSNYKFWGRTRSDFIKKFKQDLLELSKKTQSKQFIVIHQTINSKYGSLPHPHSSSERLDDPKASNYDHELEAPDIIAISLVDTFVNLQSLELSIFRPQIEIDSRNFNSYVHLSSQGNAILAKQLSELIKF